MRMMMILRDFQDIIAEILQSAQVDQGITKTRVMYEVQLSFTQIKEYFQYLQQNELVSYDKENRVFRTTTKGKKFLKLYNEMTELTSGRISEKFKT
jgi:predicted transcriptional regulator